MADRLLARCGIDCEACSFRGGQTQCPGCGAAEGKLFWGECALAKCCIGKGHDHCGQCEAFPCETLKEYSYDKEHGDNGERIRNLEALIAGD